MSKVKFNVLFSNAACFVCLFFLTVGAAQADTLFSVILNDSQKRVAPNHSSATEQNSAAHNHGVFAGMNNAGSGASGGVGASNSTFAPLVSNGRIAFASNRTGNDEIYTMNADGSNQINVSNNAAGDDNQPAWSPNGGKIAFLSYRNNNYDIYSMNADGSNQVRLTTNATDDLTPSWSPDGTKIVFFSYRTGGGDIYLMNADGSNQIRLTTNGALDYAPKFSPDGSRIVFESNRDGGNYEIYAMNADGTNQTRLTNNSSNDNSPAFSPDGSKIAFYSNRTGGGDIYAMNADGGNPVNLSNNPATDDFPAWSPDGTKIAFYTARDGGGEGEIYAMNADGTNQTRLTSNKATDYYPAWQPNLSPTAASVTVGGRVTTADGSGIKNAFVTLTDERGDSRTTLTGKFGAYRFRDVAAGETYVISAAAKRFTFSQPSLVRTISEDLTDVDFVANENYFDPGF